jgi:hypothetical protein
MRFFLAPLLLPAIFLLTAFSGQARQPKPSPNQETPSSTADSQSGAARFAKKLDFVRKNALLAHPDQRPTVFTEAETNDYLASTKVKLPDGLQQVRLHFLPGAVTGDATVDFDQLTAARHSSNPLLAIFSGVHSTQVKAHAHGDGGQGKVHIDSMTIDDVLVPRFVLEMFLQKFIQPKYPQVGIDSQFKMPAKIDLATVGTHTLTVNQK